MRLAEKSQGRSSLRSSVPNDVQAHTSKVKQGALNNFSKIDVKLSVDAKLPGDALGAHAHGQAIARGCAC